MIEASKQIYAASPVREVKRKRPAYLPVGQGTQRGVTETQRTA